jgi:hypothetical protein
MQRSSRRQSDDGKQHGRLIQRSLIVTNQLLRGSGAKVSQKWRGGLELALGHLVAPDRFDTVDAGPIGRTKSKL